MKSILDECGLSYVWFNQYFDGGKNILVKLVENSFKSQYLQTWSSSVNESGKCYNYKIYKTEHKLENFYCSLPDVHIQTLVNFRLCNNHMPVEKCRWLGINRQDRRCTLCNMLDIGDEFHYLFRCTHFNNDRNKYLPFIRRIPANVLSFRNIMLENDTEKLIKLCKFVSIVMKTLKNPPGNLNTH